VTDELCFLTIAQSAELIRARKLSPVELAQAQLKRIAQLDPQLNAYVTVTADLAPTDMRGRYQAAFGLINNFFYGFGPVIGGYLFDVGHGPLIWLGSLILGLAVAFGFRAFGPRLFLR